MESLAIDQQRMLQGVSRTFALTIPLLPPTLQDAVGNAYLVCRVMDTIEDDSSLTWKEKKAFLERFTRLVHGEGDSDAATFAAELAQALAPDIPASERDLIINIPGVVAVTHSLKHSQGEAIARCVSIMGNGMAYYQQYHGEGKGLPDTNSLDNYCYCVAGVVGELLAALFCDYDTSMASRRRELTGLGAMLGHGLQMTNIIKDVHEDRARGACWLPLDLFAATGCARASMQKTVIDAPWRTAMGNMVGLARWYLGEAVRFSLAIPGRQSKVRQFCLWSIGMSVWTLRKVSQNPGFSNGNEVKISRKAVCTIGLMVRLFAANDKVVRWIFAMATRAMAPVLSPVQLRAMIAADSAKGGSSITGGIYNA